MNDITHCALILRTVEVKSLRCHTQTAWTCSSGMNLFVGENGCGKSTLLEAIHLMAHGRSFRQARDPCLVRRGEDQFFISGRWTRFGPMYVQVQGKRGRTEISLQGKLVQKRMDLKETLPVLVDAPQAMKRIDGLPGERRRWLDALVMACRDSVVMHYRNYLRCMMQRGRLLRNRGALHGIEAWEEQLVMHGLVIMQERQNILDMLNGYLQQETDLSEGELSLEIQQGAPDDRVLWQQKLKDDRAEDARMGRLRTGPHGDRLRMMYRDQEIRHAGSRGQQKLVGMALMLAERMVRTEYRGVIPVLLLDDSLEALDVSRQHKLLHRLARDKGQILMTAPDAMRVPRGIDIQIHDLTPDSDMMSPLAMTS